jgi:thioredoxin reductase (NADPH)
LKYFDDHGVAYEWHDVDQNEKANEYVLEVSKGKRIVPVIRFQDGSILVEPRNDELASKLAE